MSALFFGSVSPEYAIITSDEKEPEDERVVTALQIAGAEVLLTRNGTIELISDGISVSMLEAMAMGSFPIQSCTACANEWIEHGVSGMIVPPEDPDIIEMAIRMALSDDELVNRAAEINRRVVQERMDSDRLKQEAIEIYSRILRIQKS